MTLPAIPLYVVGYFSAALCWAGLAMFAVAIYRFRKPDSNLRRIALSLSTLAILIFLTRTGGGIYLGACFSLLRNEDQYQSTVDRILTAPPDELGDYGHGIRVDDGTTTRVAFSWSGILDNWDGVVFDPSGRVLEVNAFKRDWSNWNSPELREMRALFGGDMYRARHLWGPWYYCSFT